MLPAHNLSKVCFLNAYGFLHIFNIVILLETYLDSNVLSEDANLEVQGYELIRTDFLSNFKRGGFCMYYKHIYIYIHILPVRLLQEYVIIELNFEKHHLVVALYQLPKQLQNRF